MQYGICCQDDLTLEDFFIEKSEAVCRHSVLISAQILVAGKPAVKEYIESILALWIRLSPMTSKMILKNFPDIISRLTFLSINKFHRFYNCLKYNPQTAFGFIYLVVKKRQNDPKIHAFDDCSHGSIKLQVCECESGHKFESTKIHWIFAY